MHTLLAIPRFRMFAIARGGACPRVGEGGPGELPETVRDRVRVASIPELKAWAEAVLDAASLDGVLASAPGR